MQISKYYLCKCVVVADDDSKEVYDENICSFPGSEKCTVWSGVVECYLIFVTSKVASWFRWQWWIMPCLLCAFNLYRNVYIIGVITIREVSVTINWGVECFVYWFHSPGYCLTFDSMRNKDNVSIWTPISLSQIFIEISNISLPEQGFPRAPQILNIFKQLSLVNSYFKWICKVI